jgi:uncharacterized protein (DUF849 family)
MPTADLDIARRTMDLIAERCPILIQLSTGVGLHVPFEERAALVELRPRMATLNPCSMSFGMAELRNPPADVRRLAARMQDLGVGAYPDQDQIDPDLRPARPRRGPTARPLRLRRGDRPASAGSSRGIGAQ